MAQYRQLGGSNGARNGVVSDHVSIGVRGGGGVSNSRYNQHPHHRRSKPTPAYKISAGLGVLSLFIILSISAFFYFSLQSKGGEMNRRQVEGEDTGNDTDFLMNVTRIQKSKELKFGHGSAAYGRDSRYWDKDDRRRDEDYNEDEVLGTGDNSVDNVQAEVTKSSKKSLSHKSSKVVHHRGSSLYNEAGRNELKIYEAEYDASLKNIGESKPLNNDMNQQSVNENDVKRRELDAYDEYDDGIDFQDDQTEEYDTVEHYNNDRTAPSKVHVTDPQESSREHYFRSEMETSLDDADKGSTNLYTKESLSRPEHLNTNSNSGVVNFPEDQPVRRLVPEKHSGSKKKSKRRKFSGACEMRVLDSSALLIEPLESRKFSRFSLQYSEIEEKDIQDDEWELRFAGHQSLTDREESFIAHDQKINCGFVRGPKGSPTTGFDLAEDDAKFISSCHIAVMSCIFGNSDRLRSPMGRSVSRTSRKNVCFVMFMDEVTLQTLSLEGQTPDTMGFIGLWKIVVVKNLPYTDMRRVGKIPKFLPHRLFPSARYSIWLDSKLRLQLDPLVILEYFLWRKGYEYAISNHYDRHCLWEEVAQNKKLNKYNHTVIDEQFSFYQADGMTRFNASEPKKLLPSNVPEGSFIVRAHTPMSNLFSCLWFNEVDRFTPRDQLSFAYTYRKLRRKNPEKPFYLNMFKDCERRRIAKLYHHRSQEKKTVPQHETL